LTKAASVFAYVLRSQKLKLHFCKTPKKPNLTGIWRWKSLQRYWICIHFDNNHFKNWWFWEIL